MRPIVVFVHGVQGSALTITVSLSKLLAQFKATHVWSKADRHPVRFHRSAETMETLAKSLEGCVENLCWCKRWCFFYTFMLYYALLASFSKLFVCVKILTVAVQRQQPVHIWLCHIYTKSPGHQSENKRSQYSNLLHTSQCKNSITAPNLH